MGDWDAGPAELGRGVVVAAGGDPGSGAAGWPRYTVDDAVLASPADLVGRLARHHRRREPVVIELAVDAAALAEPETNPSPPWMLGCDFTLWRERLAHLVWANSWDLRTGEPIWWWARKAQRRWPERVAVAGADQTGDVVTSGGRALWIDGGPRGTLISAGGLQLWPAEHVEAGATGLERTGEPDIDLAPDQHAAVTAPICSAVRVDAPAGAGKTRVLTARIRHLVEDRGVAPRLVTAVAYNKKAADEMTARLGTLGDDVQVRTVHSLAYAILRAARQTVNVIDEFEVRSRLERLVETKSDSRDPFAPWLEALSEVRLGLRSPAVVEAARGDVEGFADVFGRYRHGLARDGVVDFDEQVYAAIETLLTNPQVRRGAQLRCRHLLVDEFQDLTPAFLLLVRLLADPAWRVFGVGDPDQVLYSYAGADPRFLVDYAHWFPEAVEVGLETNWRCPADVVEAADRVLRNNKVRIPKTIRPARTDHGMELRRVGDVDAEALEVLRGWLAEGVPPTDIAVLARVNSALLPIQASAKAAGIAVSGGVGSGLLSRSGVRAALAYLRLATSDTWAGADLAFVGNRPKRWMRRDMRSTLERQATWTPAAVAALGDAASKLCGDVLALRKVATSGDTVATLRAIRDLLVADLAELDGARQHAGTSHGDDLDALVAAAAGAPSLDGFEAHLQASVARTSPRGITLASVHRTKGLEWPCVIVLGAHAPLMPHSLAEDNEEERRIFHVAITRAQTRLVVLADANAPAPFVDEVEGKASALPARSIPRATGVVSSSGGRTGGRPQGRGGRQGRTGGAGEHTWGGKVTTRKVSVQRAPTAPRPTGGTKLFSSAKPSRPKAAGTPAAVGLAVTISGFSEGTITELRSDDVLVALSTGAKMGVRYGESVRVDGKLTTLARPE